MNMKAVLEREKYVVLHGQSWRFRVVKYLILGAIAVAVSSWKGWIVTVQLFAVLFILGTAVHFLFRWKTKAWTQSWGPYKKLDLPKEYRE
jgi:hypothetical protein